MKFLALIFLLLGVLLILGPLDLLGAQAGQVFEIFFGSVFIIWAVSTWIRGKWFMDIGSFIFGLLLVFDAFKIGGIDMSGGQLFAAFIGAMLLNAGIAGFRVVKKGRRRKGTTIERFNEGTGEVEALEVNIKGTMLKLNLSSDTENLFDFEARYDPGLFRLERTYEVEDRKGYLSLENVPLVRKLEGTPTTDWTLKIKEGIPVELKSDTTVSSMNLDLSKLKAEDVIVRGDVSKITLTPSAVVDSTILIESDVSLIKLKIPRNVGVMLKHQGEISWRTFKDLTFKDGVYVSENYSSAAATAEIYIISDVSKVSIEWINVPFK
ncbi:MAG: hypothetical protein PWP09_1481 [Thermotogota bacterium]|nr:hypothetical protein [Thermotogota bacterium]